MKTNIIALDMDGVVNSRQHITRWYESHLPLFSDMNTRDEIVELFKEEFDNSTELVFPDLAKRITDICEKTGSYILWSSSWRISPKYKNINDAKEMFNRRGLPGDRLIGYTPQLHMYDGGYRGTAIRKWLENNDVISYDKLNKCAVIDDRADAGYNLPDKAFFFWIDETIGITDYEVEKIIKYFNEED